MPEHHLVVVPHTHWDREWYRTHEEFRYRLTRLLDGLLDLLEGDPGYRHFTLDGQTIVLDDYLEVRPEARARVAELVREGRLLVGPWYVLPDEWLVSGEALIRNLRLGLAEAAELGAAMPLGYLPDQFGHIGQLPQIFVGFGFQAAVLWRGVGSDVEETAFAWEAPDGTRVFTVYLVHGYSNGVHLPLEPAALAERLAAEAGNLARRSRIPSLLLMNGGDHVEPQPGLPAALEVAAARLEGVSVEIGTLPGFVRRARRESPGDLPVHLGELRSGLRAPLLGGCASARAPQKRAEFLNDRLLTRYLEPLAAWLEGLGGDGDPAVIEFAWRVALQNHPHDSICGCSIDRVHAQMEARFARVADLAEAHLKRVAAELADRVAVSERGFGRGARASVFAWNPGAAGPRQVEGELEVDLAVGSRRAPALHLRGASGRRIPAHAELVEAGAILGRYAVSAEGAAFILRGFPAEFMGLAARGLRWRRNGDELAVDVLLGADSPPGDFELDEIREACLRELESDDARQVVLRTLRVPRVRLRFVDDLPGCGLRVYRLARGAASPTGLVAQAPAGGGAVIGNAVWRVEADPDGAVHCVHLPSGTEIRDAVRLVSEADRGDAYSFDPVPGAEKVDRPARVRVGLAPSSQAEVGIVLDARYRVPAALSADRRRRSSRRVWLPARIRLRLAEGLDRVDLDVQVTNTAEDHRLRAHVRAPFAATAFEVESAFEVAARPIAPRPSEFRDQSPAELPTGATPQRTFATLAGASSALTVANRGAAEAEAVSEADGTTSLALTVLRAVGWLSRGDLAVRPGHAGPPLATPGAQVPGAHRLELSWRLHPPGDPSRTAAAHGFAVPALALPGGSGAAGPLGDGARILEVDDPAIVVSAIEPRPEGAPLVRLYNGSPEPRRVRVRWNAPGARMLEAVDLLGRPDGAVPVEPGPGAEATLALRGWQLVSLRPR